KYRGHKWVGYLNGAFIEVWRADKRLPIKYQPLQIAPSCNRLSKTIGLKIRDFIEEDWEVANTPDRSIPFDRRLYVPILRKSPKPTAEPRYKDHIRP
ncbi:hypothetical protein V1517DRAFT_261163, partial [Lipomyces orientalis]